MPRKLLNKEGKEKEHLLLSFLRQTKEGKYAQIDEISLPYSRLDEETESIESPEEEFYYSIS